MKREYKKPVLAVESFQLDASVAASCSSQGYVPIGYSENTCTFDNGQFFNLNNCQFDLTGPDGDGNDTLCYHGPLLAGSTFISS